MGRYSDQFITTSGAAPTMRKTVQPVHAVRTANSAIRKHVIPLRFGSDSRKAMRGGVFPALRAPLNPPQKNTPATASHTVGIIEKLTWGVA